jgi:O-antigen/teichoic acid export membrane protein
VTARRRRFVKVLGGLAGVNVVVGAFALFTGPLQARLLGPNGRGQLALIVVVTGLAPAVLGLGLEQFTAREVNHVARRGALLGTVTLLALALGLLGALLAFPVSRLFGEPIVQRMIFVGLLILPVLITGFTLTGAFWGGQRWRVVAALRIGPPLLVALIYVALALSKAFTVTSASVAIFAATIIALAPVLRLPREVPGWTFERPLARRALRLGSRINATTVANEGNLNVDQLFVAGAIGTHALGYYAVAGTLAGATLMVPAALSVMLMPMVATGDRRSVRRILRVTLTAMLVAATALALLAEPFLVLLFGSRFSASAPIARILAFESVFVASRGILTAALVGDGRPGETAKAEIGTFVFLVPALALLVPRLGVEGAAGVVVVANMGAFIYLLARCRRAMGGGLREYLVPTREDLVWMFDRRTPAVAEGTG